MEVLDVVYFSVLSGALLGNVFALKSFNDVMIDGEILKLGSYLPGAEAVSSNCH
jgi:hypothetical protein